MAGPNDPLYDLAVQAGLFPAMAVPGGGVMPASPEPDYGQAVPPALAQENPEVMGGGLAPPSYTPIPTLPPEGPVGLNTQTRNSQALSLSGSSRGFDEGQFGKVSRQDQGLFDQYKASDALAAMHGQQELDAVQGAAGHQAVVDPTTGEVVTPGTGARGAAEGLAQAHVNKITGEAAQANFLSGIQAEFANSELEATSRAQSLAAQSKADYMAALSDFRASKVDPSQLWGAMSGGQRFGTLVTAFVHDFLGAKGIKTSAMDTINKAIDRNIDSQLQAIKTKGEVAEGFKSLWWMQRNQAASDVEARERVRGFLLEGAKQHVIANMAQYESGLATAQGQAAIAAIDKELAQNFVEISRHVDGNALQMRNQALELHKAKIQAAVQQQANSIRMQELTENKRQFDKKQGEGAGIPEADFIVNPETGMHEWRFKGGLKDETIRREVQKNLIGVAEVNRAMTELQALDRKLTSSIDGVQGSRLEEEDARNYEAIRLKLAHAMVKANGERATDKDVDHYLKSIPRATKLTKGGVSRILNYTQKEVLAPTFDYVQQYAVDLPKESQFPAAQGRPFGAAHLQASLGASGALEETTYDQRAIKKAAGLLAGPAALEAYDDEDVGDSTKTSFNKFRSTYVEQATALANQSNYKPGEVPGVALGMTQLGTMAAKGDSEAFNQLELAAAPYLRGGPGSEKDWQGAYAAMILGDVRKQQAQ